MDCRHARLLLTFARDRADLDASDAQGLQNHLGQCPDCDGLATSERQLDHALGRAMRAVPVPVGLKERLLGKLVPSSRPWMMRVVPVLLAACLLLGVALSWRFIFTGSISSEQNADLKFFPNKAPSIAEVEDWYKSRGVPMAYPTLIDENRLDSISIAYYQGKPVARLLFVDDAHKKMAHVLCLDQARFKTEPKVEPSVNYRVHSPGNGFMYLIIFTGSLDPFLREGL